MRILKMNDFQTDLIWTLSKNLVESSAKSHWALTYLCDDCLFMEIVSRSFQLSEEIASVPLFIQYIFL